MCGIVGYIGQDVVTGRAFVERGLSLLAHRGPDDEGVFAGQGVVLGHRRLSIVDLTSAGHQPMTSADGRWTIVYNGEVYNHLDLRGRLGKSWDYRSRTDSESVLAAIANYGTDAFASMVGMWAFAVWDAKERRLLLSRDRYGQKPLYWRRCADYSFRFASEIAPLLDDGERPAMYAPAVAEYLATGNYGHLGDRTFFRDVRSFPPAHWSWLAEGETQPSPQRYWRYPSIPVNERRPYDDKAAGQFRIAFDEAVQSQLMSDVPIGVTLSGGIDSSAVVGAIASTGRREPIPVFTAQAVGSKFDESRYVEAVRQKWDGRIDVHAIKLERMRVSEVLRSTIRVQEEPFGDPSIAAHGLLMDAARAAGVPVILGGQGSDEMLFGYGYLGHSLLAASLRRGRFGWATSEARALGMNFSALARVGLAAAFPGAERRARLASRIRRRNWLSDSLQEASRGIAAEVPDMIDLEAVSIEAVERTALPHLTHYDDRSGMWRSIEGRMPFLDHRLADVVAGVDERAFLSDGRLKRILRDACSDLLPDAVIRRSDKIGFFTPLRDMLAEEADWVRQMVSDDVARSLDLYDAAVVGSCVESVSRGNGRPDAAHIAWRALSVRVWAEQFNINPSGSST